MTNHRDYNTLLPFPIIAEATKGNVDALCKVLDHYDGYITKLCTRTTKDNNGTSFYVVDEEMRNKLRIRLIMRTLAFQIR